MSAGAQVYRSAALAVLLQWTLRLIGLVSVFVLARLLSPADFGLVGLAMATVALVEIFSVIGLRQALVRIAAPGRDYLDTAWTIQLILFGSLTLLLLAVAPGAAALYGQPALTPLLAVLSLRFLFLAIVNIGIVQFERDLDFGRDLRMRVASRLAAFVITLAAAFVLRSYWALVIGLVLQSGFLAAASYLSHPYRPRLSLARRGELLGVSLWMFFNSTAQVMQHQVERLVLGHLAPLHIVGLYSVTKDLAAMFTHEISTALNRVTFVTVARTGRPLSEAPRELGARLGAYAMIAAPLGLGLAATAGDAVGVLLGAQWLGAAPLLEIVAPASALYAVFKLISSSLQASGLERLAAFAAIAGALLTLAAAIGAALAYGSPVAIALAALAASAVILAGSTIMVARVARASALGLFAHIARPFVAALAMAVAIRFLGSDGGAAGLDLVLNVALGAASFFAALALVWLVCGRPAGAEREALGVLRDLGRHRLLARRRI